MGKVRLEPGQREKGKDPLQPGITTKQQVFKNRIQAVLEEIAWIQKFGSAMLELADLNEDLFLFEGKDDTKPKDLEKRGMDHLERTEFLDKVRELFQKEGVTLSNTQAVLVRSSIEGANSFIQLRDDLKRQEEIENAS